MPYASQYMQLNGGPQLFVVLASENVRAGTLGDAGWRDDRTQHGRLVKRRSAATT